MMTADEMTAEEITTKEKVRELFEELGQALPADSDRMQEGKIRAVRLVTENTALVEKSTGLVKSGAVPEEESGACGTAGVILGYLTGERSCQIIQVYLRRPYRTADNIRRLVWELIRYACRLDGAEIFEWRCETDPDRDPYEAILRKLCAPAADLPELSMESVVFSHRFLIRFASVREGDRRMAGCTEEFLLGRGIHFVRLREAGPEIREEVRKLSTKDSLTDLQGLLPTEDGTEDPENSLYVVDAASGRLRGWFLCRQRNALTVELARSYTLPEFRRDSAEIYIGGCVMNRLASAYQYLEVQVLDSNAPMLFFIRKFFRGAYEERLLKVMTIRVKKGVC